MELYVSSVGVAAPGLEGWPLTAAALRNEIPYRAEPLSRFVPAMLPANERRRATATIRLALRVAAEAMAEAPVDSPAAVFSSCDGDLDVVDHLCRALALPERQVSPTHFHNSVHNAPAGYWSIASDVTAPSTSLSAWDGSFAAGLLEATTMTLSEGYPTLLVAYDQPAPPPLDRLRTTTTPFAVALVLTPDPGRAPLARLDIALGDGPETAITDPLEALRRGNPAARALPLLAALAGGIIEETITLPYLDDVWLTVRCRY
jgi:hypothetical protein